MEGRRPVESLSTVHHGEIIASEMFQAAKADRMHPDKNQTPFGVCKVIAVDAEEHFVTLRSVIGSEQEFDRVPIPITYPGAGSRRFMGSIPEIGDFAVVGWMNAESDGSARYPVILTWVIPGVWTGRNWLTTSGYSEQEHDGSTAEGAAVVQGVSDQIRHKLRHVQPGNAVASSSQGSDMVLDESASLVNRRGVSVTLRDADQAVVTRGVQDFGAFAGVRTYSGQAQRDALYLPTTMASDGKVWDDLTQVDSGEPIPSSDLREDPTAPEGLLTPADPFVPVNGRPLYSIPDRVNPYTFLKEGGFIDEEGYLVPAKDLEDRAVYGGKTLYRVSVAGGKNAHLWANAPALTEHRVELHHSSDGRLPVTEQTDGFNSDVDQGPPYMEWVMGSVVGNDPTPKGRSSYGLPMMSKIFDEFGDMDPQVRAARYGEPLSSHAASLFRIQPLDSRLLPTWWSVNKTGQLSAHLSGPTQEVSADVALAGGLRLSVGGELDLRLNGGISLESLGLEGMALASGGLWEARGQGMSLSSSQDLTATANGAVRVQSSELEISGQMGHVSYSDVLAVQSGRLLQVAAEEVQVAVGGRYAEHFSGPKQLLPTSGPLHTRQYVPNFPGLIAEEVVYESGSRVETFQTGDHRTTIQVGNLTYETEAGEWKARSGQNTITLSENGGEVRVGQGDLVLRAVAGKATLRGDTQVVIESTRGAVEVRAHSFVSLGAPVVGIEQGPILCAGTREPLTNLPFSTWGLGARNHILGG